MNKNTHPHSSAEGLTYSDAGVSIDAGNKLVKDISSIAARTRRPEVLGGLGGFSALFELPWHRYRAPVLVSSTDGVGTKLKIATTANQHHTIGIDLVAMCVNDIIVTGAEPLFFLDYFATGHLENAVAKQVIASIGEGCEQAGMALVGGETAEMPGMYQKGDYDIAGFCVGLVEKDAILGPHRVQENDTVIAIASSGVHSNGFSLVRKVLEVNDIALDSVLENGQRVADALLTPTRIYVKAVHPLCLENHIHAAAHITGGGILENVPRVLPDDLAVALDNWEWPWIFQWLQEKGHISTHEMLRTFNCGVGMVLIVNTDSVPACLAHLKAVGETAWTIGHITRRHGEEAQVILAD